MNEQILKNPITNRLRNSINSSKEKLNFAVPFLNEFALSILSAGNTANIPDKRLLTKFHESSITSFNIPVLRNLLDLGFEIRYNNKIHLKLYITDSETYVTSANLTSGGFETNIELTIRVDSANENYCQEIFNTIWHEANNVIDKEFLNDNWDKYLYLRKRDTYAKEQKKSGIIVTSISGELDVDDVLQEISNLKLNYSETEEKVKKAKELRTKFREKLNKGFHEELFYAHQGHPLRYDNLFYDLSYGPEVKIASSGLRELQFRTAFKHSDFKQVINYMLPELVGAQPWDLNDKEQLKEFCLGIFDFKIPQYTEALPIRLASYFYPDHFLPIFKLDHLMLVSNAFGIQTNARTRGERLYAYTTHINDKLQSMQFDNNIKSNIVYHVLFTVTLHKSLLDGGTYDDFYSSHKQVWKKEYIERGLKILKKLDFVK